MKALNSNTDHNVKSIASIKGTFLIAAYIFAACLLSLSNSSCTKTSCEYAAQDSFPYKCTGGMDVAFLIDYTGSMGGAINNIKTSLSSIVGTIITESAGDYRLALAIFDETAKASMPAYLPFAPYTSLPAANRIINTTGPTTNQYLTVMESFGTNNNTTFSTQLALLNTPTGTSPMPMGSGNGFPEPGGMLADRIITANFAGAWRTGKTKLLIIITDAPDGGDNDINNAIDDTFLATVAASANSQQVQCILISSQASGGPSNYEAHLIGNNTGGLKLMSANFANIATDINNMIKNLCINNSK